jgi:hypothetical protein
MAFRLHYGPNGQQVWVYEPDRPTPPRYTAFGADGQPLQEGNPYYRSPQWAAEHPDDIRVVQGASPSERHDLSDDEKAYYGIRYQDFQQIADQEGRYHWYGVKTGYDKDPDGKPVVQREAPPKIYDDLTAKSQAEDGSGAGREYWNYSGAPPRSISSSRRPPGPT